MTWVWGLKELPASETLVLLALADQANDEGFCWPTQETIAAKARCSVRSVKRAIDSLKRAELLRIEHRGNDGYGKGRKSNIYHLNVGAEFSLKSELRDNLALKSVGVVDNLDENGTFPRDLNKGSDWHSNPEGEDLGATGGTQIGVAPYLRTTNLNSIPTTEGYVTPESGGLDGVDGMEKTSQSVAADGAAGDVAPDWGLIKLCLPSAMMGVLPDSAAQVVTGLLRDALGAGWSEREILKRLAANAFPPAVRNGAGLVIYRLKDVLAAPVPGSIAPAVAEKQRKRNEWGRAEVAAILEGRSKLDLTAQENVLSTFLCGHFGCMPDQSEASVITAKLGEITEALYAKADAERAKHQVREVRVGVP